MAQNGFWARHTVTLLALLTALAVEEQSASTVVLKAIEAVKALQEKKPMVQRTAAAAAVGAVGFQAAPERERRLDLSSLRPAVEKLTHSENLTLREKATDVLRGMGG
jgi:hypothetical protein